MSIDGNNVLKCETTKVAVERARQRRSNLYRGSNLSLERTFQKRSAGLSDERRFENG